MTVALRNAIVTFGLLCALVASVRRSGWNAATVLLGLLTFDFAIDLLTLSLTPRLHHAVKVWLDTHIGYG